MLFFLNKKRIYADFAATTPLRKEVKKAMEKVCRNWANPSAIYREGVQSKKMLETERVKCAHILGVKSSEIFFTSGGTEANNAIIQGILRTKLEKGMKNIHVVTTTIEHSSILETLKLFSQHGVKVTYINPDKNGIVSPKEVLNAIRPETVLITVMYANNEIGTIQAISKIGAGVRKIRAEKISRDKKSHLPVFHVDASQAPLWLSCEIEGLRADAMTLDAHKMQGPKGVGALVVRDHVSWEPLMIGGGQERDKRPTTESLELITGFTKALELAQKERKEKTEKTKKIQKYFFEKLAAELPQAMINGSLEKRLANNVNISLSYISDPEMTVLQLDKAGIACSTKSSCLKGEENSYVVASLGGDSWRAKNTLRFTFSPDISKKDIDVIILSLKMLK